MFVVTLEETDNTHSSGFLSLTEKSERVRMMKLVGNLPDLTFRWRCDAQLRTENSQPVCYFHCMPCMVGFCTTNSNAFIPFARTAKLIPLSCTAMQCLTKFKPISTILHIMSLQKPKKEMKIKQSSNNLLENSFPHPGLYVRTACLLYYTPKTRNRFPSALHCMHTIWTSLGSVLNWEYLSNIWYYGMYLDYCRGNLYNLVLSGENISQLCQRASTVQFFRIEENGRWSCHGQWHAEAGNKKWIISSPPFGLKLCLIKIRSWSIAV